MKYSYTREATEMHEDINALVALEDAARALVAKAREIAKSGNHYDTQEAADDLAGLLTDALGDTTGPAIADLALRVAKLEDVA